jgi:VanZ family protein
LWKATIESALTASPLIGFLLGSVGGSTSKLTRPLTFLVRRIRDCFGSSIRETVVRQHSLVVQLSATMKFSRRQLRVLVLLTVGAGLLLAGAFLPISESLTSSPVVQRCFDALHLPLFALAAGAVLGVVLTCMAGTWDARKRRFISLVVAGGFVGIAGLVEVIQPMTGRSASWSDFFYGAIGAGLGVWWVSRRKLWSGHEKGGFFLTALLALAVVGLPVFLASQHSRQLTESFPQLLVEEPAGNLAFWHGEGGAEMEVMPSATEQGGASSLRVATRPHASSGVNFRPNAGAADWSEYQHLVLQVFSVDEAPLTLGLKIEDFESSDHSTRFNHSIPLSRGRHEVRIALGEISPEQLDLSRVKRLALFVSGNEPARSFVIEGAFLE